MYPCAVDVKRCIANIAPNAKGMQAKKTAEVSVKVWCFYHRVDLDGHCAGAVVRKWCWENGHEFVPRGVNYGEEVKWSEGAGPGAMAVIVDFTPEGQGAAGFSFPGGVSPLVYFPPKNDER